jgi:hypothetical protein
MAAAVSPMVAIAILSSYSIYDGLMSQCQQFGLVELGCFPTVNEQGVLEPSCCPVHVA